MSVIKKSLNAVAAPGPPKTPDTVAPYSEWFEAMFKISAMVLSVLKAISDKYEIPLPVNAVKKDIEKSSTASITSSSLRFAV